MKKFLLAIAAALVVLAVSSAYSDGSQVGQEAPNFVVANDSATVELGQLKGRYVLLTFWSSTDAQSRLANKAYSALAAESDVEYVAVNFDPSAEVFREIVKIDGLDAAAQFHADDDAARTTGLWADYDLRQGYNTLLIAPDGEVLAQNPAPELIAGL